MNMKHYHLLMILILLSGCTGNIQKDNGKEEYFVFFSSKYMKLNESHSYATYPWIIEEFERNKTNTQESNEILVTHSCGLFEVEIEGIWLRDLEEDLQKVDFTSINVYYPGGEFCNISHLISIQPKLLSVKKWNGELFIQDYWELKYIDNDQLAILNFSDALNLGITQLFKDIPTINQSINQSIRSMRA